MLVDPLEQATYCFKQLYSSIRLRGVLQANEETEYLEEYLSFFDVLHKSNPDVKQLKILIADAIYFISGQEA